MAQGVSRRALVTGGTGFVGSHLVERLLRNGYSVTCLVRDLRHLRWLDGMAVRLIQGDCTRPESLSAAVQGVSLVFHCAGVTKAKHARDYYIVNHLGTKNLLEACARYNPGIEKFILVSSQAAAGPSPDGQPVDAGNTAHPVSDYGRSKLLAEGEAGVFANPVVPPATTPGRCLFRTSYMATHTDEMLDRTLGVIEKAGRKLGVIS